MYAQIHSIKIILQLLIARCGYNYQFEKDFIIEILCVINELLALANLTFHIWNFHNLTWVYRHLSFQPL